MTGDGELQEGQNWEAFASAAHQRVGNLWAIVDRNELQSDRPTEEILALGDLEAKLRAFGWHVEVVRRPRPRRARGGVRSDARRAGRRAEGPRREHDQGPRRVVHGASAPRCAKAAARIAGTPAPPTTSRSRARTTSSSSASRDACRTLQLEPVRRSIERVSLEGEPESGVGTRARRSRTSTSPPPTARSCSQLVERASGARRARCRPCVGLPYSRGSSSSSRRASSRSGSPSRTWCRWPPDSRARDCCRSCNSFASFLASRANEQIYNQASERTKVVYALHYAGLIPAGPGQVAPERARHLAARCSAERRPSSSRRTQRRRERCCAGPSRTRRERRGAARDRPVAAAYRARRCARLRTWDDPSRRRRSDLARVRAGDGARGPRGGGDARTARSRSCV